MLRPQPPAPLPTLEKEIEDWRLYEPDGFGKNVHRSSGKRESLRPAKPQVTEKGTQSDETKTKTVGTMPDSMRTRNFGNAVQPQSSSTQTTFPLEEQKVAKSTNTPVIRPAEPRSPSPRRHTSHDDDDDDDDDGHRSRSRTHSRHRSSSPRRDDRHHNYDETRFRDEVYRSIIPTVCCHHEGSPRDQHFMRSSATIYSYPSSVAEHQPSTYRYRTRTVSPERGTFSPTPMRSIRSRSPPARRAPSALPRSRPHQRSQQTDTSLDAMKRRQHAGVQYEPHPTRETGTTPSVRERKPVSTHRSTILNISNHSPSARRTTFSPTTNTQMRDYSPSPRSYRPSPRVEYNDDDEERAPSMHDQSTMAELIVSFDHYTQCDNGPYTADHYMQTVPVHDESDEEEELIIDMPEETDIRQLPRGGSISMPHPVIYQPDTLPRSRRDHHSSPRPKRDGLDYTGKILEVTVRHDHHHHRHQQQRSTPVLNIGTEHILQQAPVHEYAVPFEIEYVHESDRPSTSTRHEFKSHTPGSVVVPVINSSRTHLFHKEPLGQYGQLRQSRSNGNFFLTAGPVRSVNSTFRLDVAAEHS